MTNTNTLLLYRSYTPRGTFGRLVLGDLTLYTVELPWRDNIQYVSCIPEGVYDLALRDSPVVAHTSRNEYKRGWQICHVPGRTDIMIHPGNTIDDVQGCIAPGLRTGVIDDRSGHQQWAVVSSLVAFRRLMSTLSEHSTWVIDIRTQTPEYP